MARRHPLSRQLDRAFKLVESCWPGVVLGLVAGFLIATPFGSIIGALAAFAGVAVGTWWQTTRGGRRSLALSMPAFTRNAMAGGAIVGSIFAVYVFLSWAKWLLALAAIGVLVWAWRAT